MLIESAVSVGIEGLQHLRPALLGIALLADPLLPALAAIPSGSTFAPFAALPLHRLVHPLPLDGVQASIAIRIEALDDLLAGRATLATFRLRSSPPALAFRTLPSATQCPGRPHRITFVLVKPAILVEVESLQELRAPLLTIDARLSLCARLALLQALAWLGTLAAGSLLLAEQVAGTGASEKEEETKEFDVHGLRELVSRNLEPHVPGRVPLHSVGTRRPILAERPWM